MRLALCGLCLLGLAACERDAVPGAQRSETPIFSSPDHVADFSLQPISADDLEGIALDGELGCSFATDFAEQPLLVAKGFVASPDTKAQALVKYGDAIVPGWSIQEGGYDAIIEGGSFDTAGMVIDIARTSDIPAGQGESPPFPAILRATEPIRGETLVEGYWTCGP